MPRNADPAGPMPAEDETGRLVLNQTNTRYAKTAFAAFLAGCVAHYSLVFWVKYLTLHILPPVTDIRGRVFGVVSLAAFPALPWLLLNLALPPRLIIDAEGITARNNTRVRRLSWEEMREIRLREITTGRGGTVQTQTLITGPNFSITWLPVYGVAPKTLAEYLITRRRQSRPTVPLELIDTTRSGPSRLDKSVAGAMAVTRTLHLILVLILGTFALLVALAASFALRGSPLAGLLLGKHVLF